MGSFAQGVCFRKNTLSIYSLARLNDDVSHIFWEKFRDCYHGDENIELANQLLHQVVNHNRPLPALHIAVRYLRTVNSHKSLDNDIAANGVEKAGLSPADHNGMFNTSLSYKIALLIKHLRPVEDINAYQFARVEWMYTHMFQGNPVEPQTLLTQLL